MRPIRHRKTPRESRIGSRLPDFGSESGFTLIEMLITALIVAMIAAAVAVGLISTARISADQRRHSEAAALAQQDQERMKGMSSKQLYGLNQNWTVTVDGTAYNGNSTATFLSSTGASTCSPAGLGSASYFSVGSTVTWASDTRLPVKEDSIITPPAGGALLVQVKDQNETPVSGVNVAATGPDYENASTDQTGCAIFGGLPTGNYTAALSTAGNAYVDVDGNPNPTSTAQVSSAGTSAPDVGNPWHMGLAATVTANFSAVVNNTVASPQYVMQSGQQVNSLSWYGAGSSLSMSKSQFNAAASPPDASIATDQLFPFSLTGPNYTGTYQLWAGDCQQMRPPKGFDDGFTVMPGSAQTVTVQEPALDVFVSQGSPLVRIQPSDVKLSYSSNSTPGCTDTWAPPIAPLDASTNVNGVLASPGQPFANMVKTGPGASASGLDGAITICADFKDSSNKWWSATSAPTSNANFSQPTRVNLALSKTNTPCP